MSLSTNAAFISQFIYLYESGFSFVLGIDVSYLQKSYYFSKRMKW
jgi:hypothetical protein